jgi:hypothetical protein
VGTESSGGRRGRFWRAAFAADTGHGNDGSNELDARSGPQRANGSADANEGVSEPVLTRRVSGARREAFANFVTAEVSILEGVAAEADAPDAPDAPARVPAPAAAPALETPPARTRCSAQPGKDVSSK